MEDSIGPKPKVEASYSSRASEGRLKLGSGSTLTGTVGTVESDWERYIPASEASVTLNPFLLSWNFYQVLRNARVLTVEPVVFLYMFGTYLYFPLYQQYFLNRYSLDVLENTSYPFTNETRCINESDVTYYTGSNSTYKSVESHATRLFVISSVANKIASVIATLILGGLSDLYGRRPVILLVALGAALQIALCLCIVHFKLNMYFFVLSGVISGMFGDFASLLMACFAYASDISSNEWRTVRIGLVEAMLFLAGLLSEGLGGFWFQEIDCNIADPSMLVLASYSAIILYTLFFLPESLTSTERRIKAAKKPKGIKSLARGARIFFCQVSEYSVWRLWMALIPIAIIVANMTGVTSLTVFFFKDLNWRPGVIGAYQATAMGSHMLTLMVLLPILVACKFSDPLISLIALLFNCGMNLFIGLSTRTYQLFIGKLHTVTRTLQKRS